MRLVDTHCHLDFDRFGKDRQAVINRAIEAGLEYMLVPAIDIEASKAAISLAEKYAYIYASVGVQPNSGSAWNENAIQSIRKLARSPKVVAIGEIGLDYYWDKTPRDFQAKIFYEQLQLAVELEKPVIIHSRDANEDTYEMLIRWQNKLKERESPLAERAGVLHSFSGTVNQAQQLVENGFYISISGPVTYKKADELRQVAASVPIEKLLIETDAPYLTPHPFRGQRNEPGYVKYVAEKIADVRIMPVDEVARITSDNAANLFRW